jgi:hypothetical protein
MNKKGKFHRNSLKILPARPEHAISAGDISLKPATIGSVKSAD